jgi:hypothetical protein
MDTPENTTRITFDTTPIQHDTLSPAPASALFTASIAGVYQFGDGTIRRMEAGETVEVRWVVFDPVSTPPEDAA